MENVHDEDVKQQIISKLRQIELLVPLPDLKTLKESVFMMLLENLSHETGKIFYPRLEFIKMLYQQNTTIITYGPEVSELTILYMILKRLKNKNLFMSYVDDCIECEQIGDQYKYKLCCVNGRIARYFASLCFGDENEILNKPFEDARDKREYILRKIYSIFMKRLADKPAYLDAYNLQGPKPNDYETVIQKLLKDSSIESGEEINFNIEL